MIDCTDGPTMADYGYIDEAELECLDSVRDHLQGVIDAFYKTGDVAAIENGLDEMCHALDMKLTAGSQPAVVKCGDPMGWHLGYQRAQIDFMHSASRCQPFSTL